MQSGGEGHSLCLATRNYPAIAAIPYTCFKYFTVVDEIKLIYIYKPETLVVICSASHPIKTGYPRPAIIEHLLQYLGVANERTCKDKKSTHLHKCTQHNMDHVCIKLGSILIHRNNRRRHAVVCVMAFNWLISLSYCSEFKKICK